VEVPLFLAAIGVTKKISPGLIALLSSLGSLFGNVSDGSGTEKSGASAIVVYVFGTLNNVILIDLPVEGVLHFILATIKNSLR
jgi:hypothetical protein